MTPEPPVPASESRARLEAGELVLVIDDEQAVREVTQAMLAHAGFESLAAADGFDGIDLCRRHGAKIAIVLLDLAMPRMDGVETLAQLRRLRPDLPILFSSGLDEHEA